MTRNCAKIQIFDMYRLKSLSFAKQSDLDDCQNCENRVNPSEFWIVLGAGHVHSWILKRFELWFE